MSEFSSWDARRVSRRSILKHAARASLALPVLALAPKTLAAGRPPTDTYFICPSVNVKDPNGMWVIGHHGGYYVIIPTKGNGSKDYLTVPVRVSSLAQIPAGWALYSSLPSYPNFVGGPAVLLSEGIDAWLGGPPGWEEGHMAMVVDNGDGSYTATNVTLNESITIGHSIPLASAAVW